MHTNDPSKKASINSLLNPQQDFGNYHLRAASWDIPSAGLEPKHPDPPPRQYAATYDCHTPMMRQPPPSRPDSYQYAHHWPHSSTPYPPMYSDERTAIHDHQPPLQSQYPSPNTYPTHPDRDSYSPVYQSLPSLPSANGPFLSLASLTCS